MRTKFIYERNFFFLFYIFPPVLFLSLWVAEDHAKRINFDHQIKSISTEKLQLKNAFQDECAAILKIGWKHWHSRIMCFFVTFYTAGV